VLAAWGVSLAVGQYLALSMVVNLLLNTVILAAVLGVWYYTERDWLFTTLGLRRKE